jgi:hypothetical protein
MGATQPSISQRVAAQRANRPAAIEQTTFCLLANPPSPGNSASPSIPYSPPAVIEISIPSTGYLLSDLEPAIPQWPEAMLRNPPVRCANPGSRTSGPITHTCRPCLPTLPEWPKKRTIAKRVLICDGASALGSVPCAASQAWCCVSAVLSHPLPSRPQKARGDMRPNALMCAVRLIAYS